MGRPDILFVEAAHGLGTEFQTATVRCLSLSFARIVVFFLGFSLGRPVTLPVAKILSLVKCLLIGRVRAAGRRFHLFGFPNNYLHFFVYIAIRKLFCWIN
jgi:hypothetical protein